MPSPYPVRRAALITGTLLTISGFALLFWTNNVVTGLMRWWPSAFAVVGALMLYRVFFLRARPSILFAGLLLFLTGVFILLLNVLSVDRLGLKELWPIFMGIVGASLIPYGACYRRTVRVSLVVPGIILIILMALFLLFSLGFVKESFADFVINWWPLLLVAMGVTLIATGWSGKRE